MSRMPVVMSALIVVLSVRSLPVFAAEADAPPSEAVRLAAVNKGVAKLAKEVEAVAYPADEGLVRVLLQTAIYGT